MLSVETQAYMNELLNICIEKGFGFEYISSTQGICVWYSSKEMEETVCIGRVYLDFVNPEAQIAGLIQLVKVYHNHVKE